MRYTAQQIDSILTYFLSSTVWDARKACGGHAGNIPTALRDCCVNAFLMPEMFELDKVKQLRDINLQMEKTGIIPYIER